MIYLADFLRHTGGTLQLEGRIDHFPAFAHDSRQVALNELFIAVRGERRDGHEFIEDAIQQGAAGIVAESSRFSDLEALAPQIRSQLEQQGVALILVKDTRLALRDYARGILQQWHPYVIAVTGSVGKTTTKEAIATILESSFPTFKSWRNYNDLLGLPLSLGRLEPRHRYAVLELGADHPGEIAELCAIIRPTVGVVTNVSAAHLQYFGSVERFGEELAQLPAALPATGLALLNGDDAATREMVRHTQATVQFFAPLMTGKKAPAPDARLALRYRLLPLSSQKPQDPQGRPSLALIPADQPEAAPDR